MPIDLKVGGSMRTIELRLGKHIEVLDGRPVAICLYELHGRLRDIAVAARLARSVDSVELITTRDEDALDRGVEPIRIAFHIAWTERNVYECHTILRDILQAIVEILDTNDPFLEVVPEVQVSLIIGGQHFGRVYNRVTMEVTGSWIDPTIERTMAGKNPFDFD